MEQRTSTGHKRSQLPVSLYSLPQTNDCSTEPSRDGKRR